MCPSSDLAFFVWLKLLQLMGPANIRKSLCAQYPKIPESCSITGLAENPTLKPQRSHVAPVLPNQQEPFYVYELDGTICLIKSPTFSCRLIQSNNKLCTSRIC